LKNFSLLSLTQRAINATVGKRKLDKAQLERPEVSLTLPDRRPTGAIFAQEPKEIVVAAIFYNEAEYIKEWIDFHLMIGVDRFILYDNGSSDHFQSILQPYIDRHKVMLLPWATFLADLSAQRLAYAHAVCNCPPTVNWLIFIDIDEFLFSEVSDNIKHVLVRFQNFATLKIPRFEFGPNGHKEKPPGLVIESYTRVSKREFNLQYAWKSVVQPNKVMGIGVHGAIVHGETLSLQQGKEADLLQLRINHYFSKSESEFENKLQRWYSWKTGERSKQRVMAKKRALFKAIVDSDGGEYSMLHFVERLKANDT
jgi:hypothetical protein